MERDVLTEQTTNIKFLVKLGKNGTEILQMLEMVCGESAMKCRTVYKWVDRFKAGRESVDDDTRAGCKSRSKIKTMLIVFSIFVELFIMNMFQQVKLLMENSMFKF
jgi:hypothetical protein